MNTNESIKITCPTHASIDLSAFRNNIGVIRNKFPSSKIILPVKANAYGHGSLIISREAERIGIEYLAVARICEAMELRTNGIRLPIIILGIETGDNIRMAILNDIELSVSSMDNIIEIEKYSFDLKKTSPVHLKINTGMTRLGFDCENYFDAVKYVKQSKSLKLSSIYTHFARSEDDREYTERQIDIFFKIRDRLKDANLDPDFYHMYNSGAVIDSYRFDPAFAVRPGIMCYGYTPYDGTDPSLLPVLTLKSKIIHLMHVPANTGVSYNHTYTTDRSAILATIPLGYGDGFFRSLSNKISVTINGRHYHQRGNITMDLTVIEVDDSVKIGDDVIIFGNKLECINDAKDLANMAGTISYEITTSISDRVQRIIKRDW